MVFEWILYDQFNYIKEIGKGGFARTPKYTLKGQV
jgi:hypothetical protein